MSPGRILVVEDDGIIAWSLQKWLQRQGYEVVGVVASGEEAITQTVSLKPDVVLMDINLSGAMDGIEAVRQIRAAVDVAVVYVTGQVDRVTQQRAEETRPCGYVVKPAQERELARVLAEVLRCHGGKLRQKCGRIGGAVTEEKG